MTRRKQLGDLAWHGFQVFVASLLVTTAAGDYLTRLRTLEFWQDLAGSAAVAVVSQLLAFAALRMCPRQVESSGKEPDTPP
jgi:hypothetical protein